LQDYAATGFTFALQNISYVDDAKLWKEVGPENAFQTTMKVRWV